MYTKFEGIKNVEARSLGKRIQLKWVLKKRYKRLDAGCPVADFCEHEIDVSER
jgi:hypothetical protein